MRSVLHRVTEATQSRLCLSLLFSCLVIIPFHFLSVAAGDMAQGMKRKLNSIIQGYINKEVKVVIVHPSAITRLF